MKRILALCAAVACVMPVLAGCHNDEDIRAPRPMPAPAPGKRGPMAQSPGGPAGGPANSGPAAVSTPAAGGSSSSPTAATPN